MRTKSGSVAEGSQLACILRSTKYDTGNKHDTIFELYRQKVHVTSKLHVTANVNQKVYCVAVRSSKTDGKIKQTVCAKMELYSFSKFLFNYKCN